MTKRKNVEIIVISLLFSIVGFLTKAGVAYTVAFIFVFGVFDLLVLNFIQKSLEERYGKSRSVNLFVYGFGGIVLLISLLMLLGFE